MEHASHVDSTPADDSATRNRFESFKFGKSISPQLSGPKQRHARSHSRNHSVSSSLSISTSRPASMKLSAPPSNDLSTFSFPRNDPPTTSPSSPTLNPASKRNSHHRRKSSVSTRRESAELMGISLPDLPQCSSENNINLGEKDSIRRRALWALEGKPDLSTPKVEIPELSTPDIEKLMFDLSTSKSFSAGSSTGFGSSLGSGKRDSFKLLASSSSNKDQLGTLVEEEEEEEEEETKPSLQGDVKTQDFFRASASAAAESDAEILPVPVAPVVAVTKPTPTRPRPATLNLKPLSLTPESLISSVQGLPTPSPTPSPRVGLKALTLGSISDDSSWTSSRCNSSAVSPSPTPRRPSLNLETRRSESPTGTELPARRSSISYRSSHYATTSLAGLPTPEMTPTFVKDRFSSGTESVSSPTDDGFFPSPPATQFTRPLSASEQHFLFKSHNALLARITDLERALSMQRRRSSGGVSFSAASRRESIASTSTDNSDFGGVEPDDEMLRLISDLKAERDELKRDVDGWRNRVGDMEKQLGIVTKRIETERRDAWVARSRVGLLDAEKSVLEKRLASVERLVQDLEEDKRSLESGNRTILKASEEKDEEIKELRKQLALAEEELVHERALRKQAELEAVTAVTREMANTMRKRASAVASFDSSSSSTDVEMESADNSFNKFGFSLNPVLEENDDDFRDDNDNALAGYEDGEDDDDDVLGSSSSSSSFDSMDHFPRSTGHLQFGAPTTPPSQSSGGAKAVLVTRSASPDTTVDTLLSSSSSSSSSSSPSPSPHVISSHSGRASLSKTWAFPKSGVVRVSEHSVEEDNADKFFGCLDDSDSNDISSLPYSYERSKSLFASGFKYGNMEEDEAPFFLPGNVGTVVEEKVDGYQVDNEEDGVEVELTVYDDNEMFGEASGITITFTPAEEEEEKEAEEELGSENQVVPAMSTKADLPPVLPDLKFDDSDEDEDGVVPFSFGRILKSSSCSASEDGNSSSDCESSSSCFQVSKASPVNVSSLPQSPPPRSAIPRSITLRSTSDGFASSPPSQYSPPSSVCIISKPSTAHFTPPARRGGSPPSFIPQAVSSPSPLRVAPSSIPKARSVPVSTFIRQPQRKPPMDAGGVRNLNGIGVSVANGSTFIPQPGAIHPMTVQLRMGRKLQK